MHETTCEIVGEEFGVVFSRPSLYGVPSFVVCGVEILSWWEETWWSHRATGILPFGNNKRTARWQLCEIGCDSVRT